MKPCTTEGEYMQKVGVIIASLTPLTTETVGAR